MAPAGMKETAMPPTDPALRILESLGALDLTSADGRAGIGRLLAEIERLAPGAIHRQTACLDRARLGLPRVGRDGPA
jgi:hypothetical protein